MVFRLDGLPMEVDIIPDFAEAVATEELPVEAFGFGPAIRKTIFTCLPRPDRLTDSELSHALRAGPKASLASTLPSSKLWFLSHRYLVRLHLQLRVSLSPS